MYSPESFMIQEDHKSNRIHKQIDPQSYNYQKTKAYEDYCMKDQKFQENKFEQKKPQKSYKDIQMESQMKRIGFGLDDKNINKNQFSKNIFNIIGNFFNPLIVQISQKQKKMCKKMGWISQREEQQMQSYQNVKILEEQFQNKEKFSSTQKKNKIKLSVIKNQPKEEYVQKNLDSSSKKNKSGIQSSKQLKNRRIIRKPLTIVQKSQGIVNPNQQRKLVKQMQKNFDCKLKNNRLYIKGMPKKPVSSFFFFFKDYSKQIHDEHQQVQTSKQLTYGSALAKRISKKWQQMTLEQKQPYKKLSIKTRQDYQRSMDEFRKQNSEVFQSFKKIKRMKANQTRRKKILKDSQVQRNEQSDEQINSQSFPPEQVSHKKQGKQKNSKQIAQSIELEQEELQIVMPQSPKVNRRKRNKSPDKQKSRSARKRFQSDHKPKSPSPSFFFFYNQKKAQISIDHGIKTGAQITKVASVLWRQLTDQQKHPYEVLADQRRKQYYEEMQKFEIEYPQEWANMQAYKRKKPVASPKQNKQSSIQEQANSQSQDQVQQIEQVKIENQQIDSLQGEVVQKQSNRKIPLSSNTQFVKNTKKQTAINKNQSVKIQRKQPSDKTRQMIQKERINSQGYKIHRPKAPVSSFFMFYKQNNAILADQFKEASGGKLVQYASQIWKNMTQSQKRPYQIQSEESREKYYKAMEEYKQKYPDEIKQRRIDLKKKHENQEENEKKPIKKRVVNKVKQGNSRPNMKQNKKLNVIGKQHLNDAQVQIECEYEMIA